MQTAMSQFLTYAQGKQTGSVTGITGSNGAAGGVSQSTLLPLLVAAAGLLTTLAL